MRDKLLPEVLVVSIADSSEDPAARPVVAVVLGIEHATNSMQCLSAALCFIAARCISVDFFVGLELEGVL